MFARSVRLAAVALLLAGSGAPRALVQSYAWASMIAANWQASGLRQAAAAALSGRAPCRICLKAQSLGQGRGQSLAAPSSHEQDLPPPGGVRPIVAALARFPSAPAGVAPAAVFARLSVPPPRAAA